ncbi:glycosyltransferase family 4 protein [Tamlana crocina]
MQKPKKILMVAMPSLHFFRWTEQLKDSSFEVYWFDITGSGQFVQRLDWVHQKVDWRLKWDFPGRHIVKKKFPKVYQNIQKINERDVSKAFEEYIQEVKPDMVHSFALYVTCTPILEVMERHNSTPWIYSSWGSDLYYFQNIPEYLKDIKRVLPRLNYLFADCNRDVEIAQKHGFKGKLLAVVPGGGGFHLNDLKGYIWSVEDRNLILIKGFQGRSGRAVQVLKAIEKLPDKLKSSEIIVFGASEEVIQYAEKSTLKSWNNLKCFDKIPHGEVLKLMGKALIYVGNSNSDGMPNTLLEAICLGAFPIQSNPGGATEDVIVHGENGLLIQNCENIKEIKNQIEYTLDNPNLIIRGNKQNKKLSKQFDYDLLKQQVLSKYLSLVD